jgi:FdhD protein
MPRNERSAATPRRARTFCYEQGAVGAVELRSVAVETAVEIAFGGAPFAVMMASPSDLEDFAYGFALTEAGIASADIVSVEASFVNDSVRLNVALKGSALSAYLSRRRALAGRTGCGVCGLEDLSQLRPLPRRAAVKRTIAPQAIGAAVQKLDAAQPLNALTRAAHAAVWCDLDGSVVSVREDVGRHNALDKLIGALLRDGTDPERGFILITSRCSYEMVAKAVRFGAGTLVAISAPTSLALHMAEDAGLDLIAIARADRALSFLTMETDRGAAA